MKNLPTFWRLFNPDRLETLDPNLPENEPLLKKTQVLKNQALARWYEEVGHYSIEAIEKALIGNIHKAIFHPRTTQDERIANLRLLDGIERSLSFVEMITGAFQAEEERKKQTAPKKVERDTND